MRSDSDIKRDVIKRKIGEAFKRSAEIDANRITVEANCTHLAQIKVTHPDKKFCEDCVETRDSWVHLRMCLTCGHVG